jgi:prepilin-type N-terminal cleavage/methylation domain-containing protein
MFQKLSQRLRPSGDRDAGLTLVEVMVAMMVFAIISVGVAYSITNALVLTRESRARAIATNLAAQQIDLVRATQNVFSVDYKKIDSTVSGIAFTLEQTVEWVDSTSTVTDCGTGTGTLQYKTVTVSVSYAGQRSVTAPVTSETVLAPSDRINDPALGTIVVKVTGAGGAGNPGVAVTIGAASSPNGAVAPATPAPTNAQGCTYALKVKPGNYDVSLAKTGNVDIKQDSSPKTTPVVVKAGTSSSASFTYDTSGRYTLRYASNYPSNVLLPSDLETTFVSTLGGVQTVTSAPNPATLFPVAYTVLAGGYVAPIKNDKGAVTNVPCVDVDPAAWAATPGNGVGQPLTAVAAAPGGTATIDVPMGVVRLPNQTGTSTVIAQSVGTTANGDPGCNTNKTYTFTVSGQKEVALPFGTWKFSIVVLDLLGLVKAQTPLSLDADAIRTRGTLDKATGAATLDPRPAA